jgi:hypothetical protein
MIPLETLVGWGATLTIIGGKHAVDSYRIRHSEEEIRDLWRWKNAYEKESNELRTLYQVQLLELKGGHAVLTEKIQNIMTILEEIKSILMTRKGD